GMKTERRFKESILPRRYHRGGSLKEEGYLVFCDHHLREVTSEFNIPATLNGFLKEIEISMGEIVKIEEYAFSESAIWEVKLHSYNKGASLNIRPLLSTNYVIIGEYKTLCKGKERAGVLMPAKKT